MGAFYLVKNTINEQLFTMKIIPTDFLNPEERRAIENEISLMQSMKGPTLLEFIDSFVENDSIHVIMEYGEGGTLENRIEAQKALGK